MVYPHLSIDSLDGLLYSGSGSRSFVILIMLIITALLMSFLDSWKGDD